MKKKLNKKTKFKMFTGFTLTAITAPILLAACGAIKGDYITVAFSDPENPRWVNAQKDIRKVIETYSVINKDKGGSSNFEMSSILKSDQGEQNDFISTDLNRANKPLGIVIGAANATSASPAIENASKDNIPVVAYDRLIKNSTNYNWYSTFDNFLVGTIQGLSIASKVLGYDGIFKNVNEMVNFYYSGSVSDATKTPADYKNLENHPSDGTVTTPAPFFYHSHKETTPTVPPASGNSNTGAGTGTGSQQGTGTEQGSSQQSGGGAQGAAGAIQQSSSVTLNTDDQQQATPAKQSLFASNVYYIFLFRIK